MATIKAEKPNVFYTGLYPIAVPSLNFVGHQNPVAPGSVQTGDVANADLNDVYPPLILMGAEAGDKYVIKFLREPGITGINVVVNGGDFTFDMTDSGDGINFEATPTGIYDYLLEHEKDIVTTILTFS